MKTKDLLYIGGIIIVLSILLLMISGALGVFTPAPLFVFESAELNQKFVFYKNYFEVFRKTDSVYKKIWEEKESFEKIDTVITKDLNNDGHKELLVLFWRDGDFLGKRDYLPQITKRGQLSQHIYIYKLNPYTKLMWGGSAMGNPINNLHFCDDSQSLCANISTYKDFPIAIFPAQLIWKGWWWEVTPE